MSEAAKVTLDKILLFGDSITEGSYDQALGFNISPALQHEYARKLEVVARGFAGYNSEHARHILNPILDAESAGGSKVILVVIFFGTNDSARNDLQYLPIQRSAENLHFLATAALKRNIPAILVGSAPADENRASGDKAALDHLAYSNAAHTVANVLNVPFVDLWHAFMESKGWKEGDPIIGKKGEETDQNLEDLLPDGVHFSPKGYRIWYELLLETIRESFPGLRKENLPKILAGYDEIDNSDLASSIWKGAGVKKD
jgi:lysophospholipase L1-like esterase